MAITFAPRDIGIGERIGTSLGSGIQQGLQQLSDQKMQQLQEQRLTKSGLPGVLAYLDPQVQAAYLKQYGAAQQMAQGQQSEGDLDQLLRQGLSPQQPYNPQLQQAITQQMEFPATLNGIQQESRLQPEKELSSEARLSDEVDRLRKIISDTNTKPQVASKARERLDKKEEQLEKIKSRNFKMEGSILNDITKTYQSAQNALEVIERNKKLNEAGGLTNPGTLAFLDEMGLDIDALKSGDTQEFIKNKGPFLENLKNIFGGRITDTDLNQYMRTIANEYQSPEGRRRILLSLEKLFKGSVARYNAANDLIDENRGVIPLGFLNKVERSAKKDLDKASKEFKQEIKKKPLPEAESKLSIAGKALAGRALGRIPDALKGAAKGAATGAAYGKYFGGGPGILGGAALGGLGGLTGLI